MPVRNRCGISETCTSRSGSYHPARFRTAHPAARDRKSTRLNSSHDQISYAVFCLKKKKTHLSHQQSTTNQNVKKSPACSELRSAYCTHKVTYLSSYYTCSYCVADYQHQVQRTLY